MIRFRLCRISFIQISKVCYLFLYLYRSLIEKMESEISALKEDLDREHKKWRTAQDNYERQVILQFFFSPLFFWFVLYDLFVKGIKAKVA